ncbi:MAG: phosphodiester glycosidase family protein, partial [Actinomycetota bacterium]
QYVTPTNGEPLSGLVASWGRDHNLGKFVDYMETVMYSTPPSKDPAKNLSLVLAPAPSVVTTTSTTTPPGPSTTNEVPTTTIFVPPAPVAIQPLIAPALQGEGTWVPIARAGGQDAIWATSLRPLPEFGGVVASMAVIDQTYLRVGMFNGSDVPGGSWARGDRVPTELYGSLVAAFNGGFRFEHIKGGYFTEGKTVKELRDGDATLAVGRDHRLALGVYGRDFTKDDGWWVSMRQNLILLVENGQSQVQHGIDIGVWWGADYGDKVYVARSAVCLMHDGRLAYAMVAEVDATQLAQSLINMGCKSAIQLDINGSWPSFHSFQPSTDGAPIPHLLDGRMKAPLRRGLEGSRKDFFAFFDSSLVPPHSVLDA